MTGVLTAAQGHVPPEVSGILVSQVIAVETNLVETLGHYRAVSSHDTVVCEEGRNHIDEVGPKELVSRWGGRVNCVVTRAGLG